MITFLTVWKMSNHFFDTKNYYPKKNFNFSSISVDLSNYKNHV